jgi:phage shock protein PspC (stress-responsive transcriptional regulator)
MTSAPPPAPPSVEPPGWQPPPPPPGPAAPRQLRRSRTDKILGGVNGGLAEYSGIDPLLWRVGFVALALAGGTGIVVYLLLWLLMPAGPPAPTGAEAPSVGRRTRRPVGPRSPVGRITIAAMLIVLGVLVLVDRLLGADLGPRAYIGSALLVVGLGLIAGAFAEGRSARGGFIALGAVQSLALISSTTQPWHDHDGEGVGDQIFRPATAAQVQPVYRGGFGDMTIDLRQVDVSDLDRPISFRVEHGFGDLTIRMPEDADVQLDIDQGVGSVDAFDEGSVYDGYFPGDGSGSWVDDGEPEFDVTINSGVGDVELSRG